MADVLLTASTHSSLGRALLDSSERAVMDDFMSYFQSDFADTWSVVAGDSALAFLDEVGERRPLNSWCDAVTFEPAVVERLMRQILLARRVVLEADEDCLQQGVWLKDRSVESLKIVQLTSSLSPVAIVAAYGLLASVDAGFGASPVVHDGWWVGSQLDWMNTYLLDGRKFGVPPSGAKEFLVITGFHGELW